MFDQLVGEEEVFNLGGGDSLDSHLAEVFGGLHLEVAFLEQGSVENRAELAGGLKVLFLQEDDAVLLLLKYAEGIGSEGGSDYHLEENLVDFLGGRAVDFAVCHEDTAEG